MDRSVSWMKFMRVDGDLVMRYLLSFDDADDIDNDTGKHEFYFPLFKDGA